MAKAAKKKSGVKFQERLVLNSYMLSLFGANSFETLAGRIKTAGEGKTASGESQFCYALIGSLPTGARIKEDMLLDYDRNILRHTEAIRGKRAEPIDWKYFQYLALLFTEIYLDKFMNRRESFLQELNAFLHDFNDKLAKNENYSLKDTIKEFKLDDLRKLAFWSATGSGKTLIMQMNIQQYLYYYKKQGGAKEKLNRILLITPNEGLSLQHKAEFDLSRIEAQIFSKDSGELLRGVEIIEITKLREESSDKTVAIDAFEDNNLVLVDEGHRGSKGDVWSDARSRIAENGFTFEYSATFGQAVAGNETLAQEYSKAILFDYSYRYFYNDGYGKDYNIINLSEEKNYGQLYRTACLLSFYQQKILFKDPRAEAKKFNIENPLWVFVGSSVNAGLGKNNPDVVNIIQFLADFTAPNRKDAVLKDIEVAISGNTGLLEHTYDVFANAFPYIIERHKHKVEDIYVGIMREIFNSENGGGLHIVELKDVDGEIALYLGNSDDAFGVINVGDSATLRKRLEEEQKKKNIHVSDKKFHGALFQEINKADSPINILIGSKKFTEGWNSYRVSTMGLMNIGRSEGSQIIQLFGRGVRLHGYENSLKRHSPSNLPELKYNDQYLTELETLNIFGIHADYMDKFKKDLEAEGISAEGWETITLPVTQHADIAAQNLKIIAIQEGKDYKRDGEKPSLRAPETKEVNRYNITLDWYPRLESQRSKGIDAPQTERNRHEAKLTPEHIAFLDMDALWFDLQQFKNEKCWFNLNIAKAAIGDILANDSWYMLFIPEKEIAFDNFEKIHIWQNIAAALLRKYCDRFYKLSKAKWEVNYREYQNLEAESGKGNFLSEYKVRIAKNSGQEQLLTELENIAKQLNAHKTDFAEGKAVNGNFDFGNGSALLFERHLYQPLLFAAKTAEFKIEPDHLNEGEKNFVEKLKQFYQENTAYFSDKTLLLLRNMSKGRGIGFFEAGNFYPDFIMWLKHGDKQYISFIDPKGLRQVDSCDPKLEFYKTIKELQASLNDSNIILNSFIISGTAYAELASRFDGASEEQLAAQHILFANGSEYIGKIFAILKKDTSNMMI